MPAPTTGEFLNQTTPPAPTGDQNVVFQSDGATPDQSITAYPKRATGSLFGTVKPDGTSIVIAGGVISTTAGTNIDNETPAGTIDGSNTTFTLAQTPKTGSVHLYLNGLRLLLTTHYTLSGDTITMIGAPATGDNLIADYRY